MKKKLIDIYLYVSLTAILLLVGYYVYCVTWPYHVVDIKHAYADHDVYKVGDDLHYTISYCKYIDVGGTVFSELADGVIYNLKGTVSNAPVGCGEKIMSVGRVPDVPAGKYRIVTTAVYQVNPFRQIIVKYQTDEFEIITDE